MRPWGASGRRAQGLLAFLQASQSAREAIDAHDEGLAYSQSIAVSAGAIATDEELCSAVTRTAKRGLAEVIVWGDAQQNETKALVATSLLGRPGRTIDVSAPDVVTVS